MPRSDVPIGPLSAIYVGNADSSSELVRVGGNRSNGSSFKYGFPTKKQHIDGKYVQAGVPELTFSLTFVPDFQLLSGGQGVWSNLIMRLAMGNSVEGTVADDQPSTLQEYSFLLVGPDKNKTNCFWVPLCSSVIDFNANWNKDQPSKTPLLFQCSNRNRFIELFYHRPLAELLLIEPLDDRDPTT